MAIAVSTVALVSCASGDKHPVEPNARGLYAKYGGHATVVAVVDLFVARVAADHRINAFFASVASDSARLGNLKAHLVEQVSGLMGGPEIYTGRSMVIAHRHMGVRESDFDALVQDFILTLQAAGVDQADINVLTPRLLALRPKIVVEANRP
jgi:hemoglobin